MRITDKTGATVTEGDVTFTGATCEYSKDSGNTNDSCPGGTSGEINGVTTCVPYDPNLNVIQSIKKTSNETTTTKTNPDGTTTSTSTDSGSTETSTTCSGSQCTTTTTTKKKNPDGTEETAVETKTEDKDDFCTQNPKSPLCREGQFGGACSSGFTCEGDAVTCAIAKAANEQACMLKVDPANSVVGVGNAAMSGTDPADHPRKSATIRDVGTLNQSNPFGATCPADIDVPVMGSTISIPISRLCPALQAMGSIAVAFSLVVAAFIVVKG